MISNKLQIYLITYNRKRYIQQTLDQILDSNSPLRNFDITILDNASTDGTSELIDEYCKNFLNLKHIRHRVNLGGNANICRAFELGASCGKDYIWILCDDDFFDFTNWKEVEKRILYGRDDIICVSNYIFKNEQAKQSPSYQMIQLSFLPANIIKASNITNDVLINMYDAIMISFPQCCLVADCINQAKKIYILSNPIVANGCYSRKLTAEEIDLTRGMSKKWCLDRRKKAKWISNYGQIISLLNDEKLRSETLEYALTSGIEDLWYRSLSQLLNFRDFNYFYEIFKQLRFKRKLQLLSSKVVYIYKTSKDIRLYFLGLKFKIFPRIDRHYNGGGGDLPIQQK